MLLFTYETTIDLKRPQRDIYWETIANVGDKKAHAFIIHLVEDRIPVDISTGYTVQLLATRHDNNTRYLDGTVVDNAATAELDKSCYEVPGELRCTMVLSKGEDVISAARIFLLIGDKFGEGIVDPSHTVPNLADVIAEIENAKAAANAANEAADAANDAAKLANTTADTLQTKITEAEEAITATDNATKAANTATESANTAADNANAAAQRVEDAMATIGSAEETAAKAAEDAATAAENAQAVIDDCTEAAQSANDAAERANTAAESVDAKVTAAQTAAENAEADAADTRSQLEGVNSEIEALKLADAGKIDGAYIDENGMLCLTANGELVAGPFAVAGGGGTGGGTINAATLTVTNDSGFLAKTIALGAACPIALTWSSTEDGMATGAGVLVVRVGGTVKMTRNIEQGPVSVDVGEYLAAGANAVKVQISDAYGNSRVINFSITTVAVSLASTFDASIAQSGSISFTYVPTGSVSKVMHFELDGTEIGTATVAVSGRQQTYVIPKQSHGAHALRAWFTCEIDGTEVTSNELYYELRCIEEGNETPIITSTFRTTTVDQFTSLVIPWAVYDPTSLTADVTLIANDEVVQNLVGVDRTEQKWTYRASEAGALVLEIVCGDERKMLGAYVNAVSLDVSAETEDLSLHLSSYGRSNNEENPAVWKSGDIAAKFEHFNWKTDGWQKDEKGISVMRVAGDARLTIPMKLFKDDFRGTGKTIEFEFASRDVLNYDAVIASCMSGGRGIQITSQEAVLKSASSTIGTQYKEDEHVRLTFVAEKRDLTSDKQLLLIYLNGILSGAVPYPSGDDFSQDNPVDISFGSSECTIDLYCIRVYDNNLNRYQILDNWIADTQDAEQMIARYNRNKIYDDYGVITTESIGAGRPYLVLQCAALPQFKKDYKITGGYYVDPINPERNFTFGNAELDVQGTSSQYYYVKNYKVAYEDGFVLPNGTKVATYAMNAHAVPTGEFTYKADVASSEGANNVVLAQLYNDLCPVKTPAQEADSRVRQTIDGHPIVIFWDNGTDVTFIGKYNFNNDKGTPEVFGFKAGDESWEIRENGSDRVGFRVCDFSEGSGWENEFEARYPEDNKDTTNLAIFASWLASTYRGGATGNAIDAVTYDGVEYTTDTAEYRLAKYKAELADHADVDALVFYYVFTEIFLCIDQREKNAFPTLYADMGKWIVLFYDADSSLGTDNKGNLAFSPYLEDIDHTDAGDPVFNGQNSVLWSNLRDAFYVKITAEYQRLRTKLRTDGSGRPLISYEVVDEAFENHQSKWCEAIYNDDGYHKSIEPYLLLGDGQYLPMLRGKKELQRKWWMFNRFRYLDSKYMTGTSMTNQIMIRAHARANIKLKSYVNMYGHVFYNDAAAEHRMTRGVEYEFVWAASGAEDAVIGINDADMLTSLGDLSALMVETIDISLAKHLTYLKVGDESADYVNDNMKSITLGNNVLLKTIDLRNCVSLTNPVVATGCTGLEEAYFDGTSTTEVSLPNGGILKKLHLPATITNLTLRNLSAITEFVLPESAYATIATLWIENASSAVPVDDILMAIPANSRVRIIGFDWTMDTADEILEMYDYLDTMRGLDENGNNVDTAQMSGTIHIGSLTGAQLAEMKSRYPYIHIDYEHIESYCYFYNGDTLLYTATCYDGADAVYGGSTPTRASTAQYSYTHVGWSTSKNATSADADALKAVTADRNVYAAFSATVRKYTVTWYNGSTLLETDTNQPYGSTPTYNGGEFSYTGDGDPADYELAGWSPAVGPITGDTKYTALWVYTGYMYPSIIDGSVTSYSSNTLTSVGEYAFYGSTNLSKVELAAAASIGESAFEGCTSLTMLILRKSDAVVTLGSNGLANSAIASGTGYVYVPAALVDSYKADSAWSAYADQIRAIEDYVEAWAKDSWEMVQYRIQHGDYASYYAIGDTIPLDLGTEGLVNMQIAAFDADDLADGSGKAHISFISKELLATSKRFNPAITSTTDDEGNTVYTEGTGTIGGWEKSELRTYLNDTIKSLIPEDVRSSIVSVSKTQTAYDTTRTSFTQTTEDSVWIPNYDECFGSSSMYYSLFENTSANRVKYKAGASSASYWWLRSAYNFNSVYTVSTSGSDATGTAYTTYGVALGFCV